VCFYYLKGERERGGREEKEEFGNNNNIMIGFELN